MELRVKKLLFILILAVALIVALVIYCTGGTGGGSNSHTVESTLALSEVMTSNKGSVPDENGNYPDWVELKNTGSTTLDVGGFGLTDDLTAGVKYVFPSGTKVEAGGYIVVWCSGESTGGLGRSVQAVRFRQPGASRCNGQHAGHACPACGRLRQHACKGCFRRLD